MLHGKVQRRLSAGRRVLLVRDAMAAGMHEERLELFGAV
jgi:hypothetical protein